ncbi:phage tail protein [Rossellomorea sp. NPDC071047]|uniref:phage tail protein n=1 Tax=Rossellomorea sp. NPDC071047 TaxID=3390675 RepID=UPI003CFEB384
MMATIVEQFDSIRITNASVQFIEGGTQQEGEKFGSLGSVEGETTLKELIKKEEGVEVRKKSKPEKMDLTISAHIKVAVIRKFFGINSNGLKPGVYQYGQDSKGVEFVLTADVIDEFEDVTKLVAFPKCVSATGFKFTIENGGDEVALMEVQLTAYPDIMRQCMYEAFVSELDDPTIAEQWHSQFNRSLVEAIPQV